MKKETDNKDALIRDAQYRKGASIAYFNSLNNAIVLATSTDAKYESKEDMLSTINEYKNLFIAQHDEYYSQVIAKIGVNYDVKETVTKVEKVKDIDELKALWLSMSADERADKEVIKAKNIIKAKFEKND